jgi:hypothetical protein
VENFEAAFLLKAKRLGFLVAKPWGDSDRYDFILDSGSRLWRVQLKSTERVQARGYEIQPIDSVYSKGKTIYKADQIDALVVHIAPCNAWYVLPRRGVRVVQDFAVLSGRGVQVGAMGRLLGSLASGSGLGTPRWHPCKPLTAFLLLDLKCGSIQERDLRSRSRSAQFRPQFS